MSSIRELDGQLAGAVVSALNDFVPRAELARLAKIPPDQLERRLAPYIEAGYPIAFHPERGVGLDDPPDVWCAEEILGRCPARENLPTWNPLLLAETGSTNDVAREQARRETPAGFLVAAARQTRGRGRLGRRWDSPSAQGLYVSFLLRPQLATRDAGQLSIIGSVSAADAVESLIGRRPRIKWPNDLLLEGRKLAGLLIETEAEGGQLAYAVLGLGFNVAQKEDDFPPELRATATSLYLATGQFYRRADLLVALVQALERRLHAPFAETREAWKSSSLTLGQQVTLETLRGKRHGQAFGLDDSGALLLRTDSGEIESITAGDMQAV